MVMLTSCIKTALINGKGGCGKTTSIFNMAGVLAKQGKRVLVVDLDKQRSATEIFLTLCDGWDSPKNATIYDVMKGKSTFAEATQQALFVDIGHRNPKYYGVDVVRGDKRLEKESTLKGVNIQDEFNAFIEENGYDWVLVDMPPSNTAINNICFTQLVDYVIVPFSSDTFSVSGYDDLMKIVNDAREINPTLNILGVYLSRYMQNSKLDRWIYEQLLPIDMFLKDMSIPFRADVREGIVFGKPISFFTKSSPSRTAYEKLVEYMTQRVAELRRAGE